MDYTPADIARAWGKRPHLLWLDSADETHPNAGWSYVMAGPEVWIEGKMAECLPRIRAALKGHTKKSSPCPAPFQGGVAGVFGYEGHVAVGVYTKLFAYDHAAKQGHFINCHPDWSEMEGKDFREDKLEWKPLTTAQEYQSRVQKVIDYILAGDIFQANLSQQFEAGLPEDFDTLAHYKALREQNPAPFGGYVDAGDYTLSCCSPERFLSLSDTGRVETKPIKGTAPRSADPAQDRAQAAALEASIKDRAENIMIVDLLRNDLSKVCEGPSVQVESLCALESFARVHHLVSTVSGQLQPGKDALDLIEACFPGGSITGAPKIRAMEIIEELEGIPRGAYTGALAWIGFDGAMDSNILIRSIIYEGGTARLNVGGGITARSKPAEEYQETLDKAAGLIQTSLRAQRSNPDTGPASLDCRVALKGSSQ